MPRFTQLISIIVPTYNSAEVLVRLLESIKKQDFADCEVVINDDPRTNDDTENVVTRFLLDGLRVKLLKENRSRAQARNVAAGIATGDCLLILDSDMELGEGLLSECAEMVEQGLEAMVIPEESFGSTFWARCRWFEKKCYEGVEEIEALRFVKAEVFRESGGYTDELIHREDKDLDLRVRQKASRVGRTRSYIYHNEGALRLLDAARKKAYYAETAHLYAARQPEAFGWETNVFNRYFLFVKDPRMVIRHPLLLLGLLVLKTSEFLAAGLVFLRQKIRGHA